MKQLMPNIVYKVRPGKIDYDYTHTHTKYFNQKCELFLLCMHVYTNLANWLADLFTRHKAEFKQVRGRELQTVLKTPIEIHILKACIHVQKILQKTSIVSQIPQDLISVGSISEYAFEKICVKTVILSYLEKKWKICMSMLSVSV